MEEFQRCFKDEIIFVWLPLTKEKVDIQEGVRKRIKYQLEFKRTDYVRKNEEPNEKWENQERWLFSKCQSSKILSLQRWFWMLDDQWLYSWKLMIRKREPNEEFALFRNIEQWSWDTKKEMCVTFVHELGLEQD